MYIYFLKFKKYNNKITVKQAGYKFSLLFYLSVKFYAIILQFFFPVLEIDK